MQEYQEGLFLVAREPALKIHPFCREQLPFPLKPSLLTVCDLKDDGVRIGITRPAPSPDRVRPLDGNAERYHHRAL